MAIDNQEQALYKLSHILRRDNEIRCNFECAACMVTFGFWDPGPNSTMWKRNGSQDYDLYSALWIALAPSKLKGSYA